MYRRHVLARFRLVSRRVRRFVLHNILHADDPPYRLALGIAIGLWVTFTPTIGFQMVLVVLLAWVLRANKLVGVPVVWLSNPVTFVPIYYPSYRLGVHLTHAPSVGQAWWQELRTPPDGWWNMVTFYWERLLEIMVPLTLGCLIIATLVALPSYIIVERTIRYYRLKRFGQLTPPSASEGSPKTPKEPDA